MTESSHKRRPFRWRALTSVVITLAFIVLLISGIILFLAPPGRVANWTNWAILGLRKVEWANLHISFSALFLLSAILHIIFNWRPLLGYFRNRLGEAGGMRWEWLAALIMGIGVYAGTRANVPPFSSLIAYSESWRESWESSTQKAPIPHAELLTLQELAEKASLSLTTVTARLEAKGIKNFTTNTVVNDLAQKNGFSAQQLYEIMTATPDSVETGKGKKASGSGHGTGKGGGGGGGGTGFKTLSAFCADEGIDLQVALKRFEAKGIKAGTNLTMREIAINNGYSKPFELLGIIRGEN